MSLLDLVHSKSLVDRNSFLCSEGVCYSNAASLVYNEVLSQEMYSKLVMYADGKSESTNAPITCVLDEKWKWWKLGNGLMVAYDPTATALNMWWARMRESTQNLQKQVRHMYGDLVLFRWCDSLTWEPLEARRELINYFVTSYLYKSVYKFSW